MANNDNVIGFLHGTLKIADGGGTGGANVITLGLEEGKVSSNWKPNGDIQYFSKRGKLSGSVMQKGPESPTTLSLTCRAMEVLTDATTATFYDAMLQKNAASAWVSDLANTDLYGFIVELSYTAPDGTTGTITWAECAVNGASFGEGDANEFVFECMCRILEPTFA